MKQALEIYSALGQMDSYMNGAEKPILYKYDGATRLQMAIARRKLRQIHEDFSEARNSVIMEITGGEGQLEGPKEQYEFSRRELEMLRTELEVDIQPITVAALKLDENPIPVTVLDLLGAMIT
jgi:hypothetical protein